MESAGSGLRYSGFCDAHVSESKAVDLVERLFSACFLI